MKCNKCGQEYDGGVCPNCGTSAPGKSDVPKKKKKFRWWYILIVIVVIGVIGALGGGDESGPTDPSGQQPESRPQTSQPGRKTHWSRQLPISALAHSPVMVWRDSWSTRVLPQRKPRLRPTTAERIGTSRRCCRHSLT